MIGGSLIGLMILLRPGLGEERAVRELRAAEIRDVRWLMEVRMNPDPPVYQRLIRTFQRPFTLILAGVAKPPDKLKMVLLARVAAADYPDIFFEAEGKMWVLEGTNWYEYDPRPGQWTATSLANVSELTPLQEMFRGIQVTSVASDVEVARDQRVALRVETTVTPAMVPVSPGTSSTPANQETLAGEGRAVVPVGGRQIVEMYQILGKDIVVPRELLVYDTHERVLCHALFRDYVFNTGVDDEEWNLAVSSLPLDRQEQ